MNRKMPPRNSSGPSSMSSDPTQWAMVASCRPLAQVERIEKCRETCLFEPAGGLWSVSGSCVDTVGAVANRCQKCPSLGYFTLDFTLNSTIFAKQYKFHMYSTYETCLPSEASRDRHSMGQRLPPAGWVARGLPCGAQSPPTAWSLGYRRAPQFRSAAAPRRPTRCR